MKYFGEGLSEKHKELSSIIRKKDSLQKSKDLFFLIHSKLHLSEITGTESNEVDALLINLKDYEWSVMPTSNDETIAWVIWHIARIEDLTMSFLVARENQIFNSGWQNKMNVPITDTGNALSDDEIMNLSQNINITQLLKYRNAVGRNTRRIVENLSSNDLKKKVSSEDLDKILMCGGVTEHKDSIWLLDFWGKKDVAGILLMPPTRHMMMHLNDCCKWKIQIRTKKKFYRM